MSPRTSRSLWPVITAALIGLPTLYLLSIGPSFGLVCWTGRGIDVANVAYQPLMRLWWRGRLPDDSDLLSRYVRFCANDGFVPLLHVRSGSYYWVSEFAEW